MGRYDRYGMGIILFFIISALTSTAAFCQGSVKGEAKNDKLTQIIKAKYPVNVAHTVKYTEDVKVSRTYNDSSVIEYNRVTNYYLTLVSQEAPQDGFLKIKVFVDSLVYDFKSDQKNLKFNSQWDDTPPLNVPDYLTASIPLSKTYTITYSPYGDIASLEDERLKEFRNDVAQIPDTLQNFYYQMYSGDDVLVNIGDMIKAALPNFAVTKDTSWISNLKFVVDGVKYSGKFKGKLNDVINGVQFVELASDSVTIPAQRAYKYGINNALAAIIGGRAKMKYRMDVAPNGYLSFTSAETEAILDGRFKNLTFKENTKSIQTWEVLGRYRW